MSQQVAEQRRGYVIRRGAEAHSRPLAAFRAAVTLGLILGVALGSGPARADRKVAAQFFAAGKQAFEKGDYLTAIRAFSESQRAKPHPHTLFALAQACRQQFDRSREPALLQQAITHYSDFLKQAPRSSWRPMARAQLKASRAALAHTPSSGQQATPEREKKSTQLMITTRVPGARVSIDGEPPDGEPAPAIRVVSPGKHRVRVEAPGHVPSERELIAVEGRLVVSGEDLVPLPGTLRVLASENGATVYLDGRRVGVTPYELVGIELGAHQVKVAHRGRRLWSSRVEVRSGATEIALANLERSTWRTASMYVALGSLATGVLGGVTGALALNADSQMKQPRLEEFSDVEKWNAKRDNQQSLLEKRDNFATASTVLLSVAVGAAVAAAALYWFDQPEAPSREGRSRKPKQARGVLAPGVTF